MTYNQFKDWLQENWPHPPDHVLARLRHTLDVFDSELLDSRPPDEDMVLTATSGMYQDERGLNVKTGLTWGDLRAIRAYLDKVEDMRPLLKPTEDLKRPTIR